MKRREAILVLVAAFVAATLDAQLRATLPPPPALTPSHGHVATLARKP